MKAFVVDVAICNGCYCCQVACKDEHVGNDWSPIAKPQPDTGQFWLKLNEFIRGSESKLKMHYIPEMCRHCDEAPCISACSVEGAIYKRDDGLVIINPEKCTGCKNCIDACPHGAIYFNDGLNIAQKCTGCAHLLDEGWSEPRCVDACPTGAIKFGEEAELKALINQAGPKNSGLASKPRAYYLNVPKKFVAGTVYDPAKDEIISGASCTLAGTADGAKLTATTDGFGDFWFEGLEAGTYSLTIKAQGFPEKTISKIAAEKDVNLGDIPLP